MRWLSISIADTGGRNILDSLSVQAQSQNGREDFSEYVAHLQLHMTLQARNLVPSLNQTIDSRHALLHETQASVEKLISRQSH
jgi:hypothetical protein